VKHTALLAAMLVAVAAHAQDPRGTDKPKDTKATTPAKVERPTETPLDRKPTFQTGGDVFIKGGRILTATHGTIEKGNILVRKGKIVAVGPNVPQPAGIKVIDATGKVVSPGIVDTHIHRGLDTTNEGTDSIVAEGRVLDVLNPDSKTIWQAAASGETTGMLLHGSANPVGAESLVIKLKYQRPPEELVFPGAPRMIKFALGENVTRSGSNTSQRFPRTRNGVEAVYRRAFTQAQEYMKKCDAWEKDHTKPKPQRDLRLETLADILRRKVWIQCHGYRADEHLMLVRLSQEFGFKIGALQHAVETYKIAPELAKAGVGVSVFDEWGAKYEIYDGISAYAAAVLNKAGVLTSFHTDGTNGTTALHINAAKAMRCGGLNEQQALQLITINGAKELGVADRTGSIDVGKDADIVIWDGHPLSVYSRVNTTLIDGEVYFQERDAFGLTAKSTFKNKLDPFAYVPSTPVPPRARGYIIAGGTIHPVSGPAFVGNVFLVDGKIASVQRGPIVGETSGRLSVINAKGMQVYPGFVDAGTTIGLTEFGQVGQATDARELGSFQPDIVAATDVNVQSEHIPVTRVQGVTTVFTTPMGGTVSGLGSVLDLSGGSAELMTINRKAALCVNWPGGRGNFNGQIDDDGDGRGTDADMLAGGAQFGFGGGASTESLTAFFDKAAKYGREHDSVDVSLEAMQPVFRREVPVFFRASTASSIRGAVEFAKKYNLRAVLVGAPDAWKEAKLLADNHIPVILEAAGKALLDANDVVSDYDPYDTPYATPALLKKAGVKFCFMSDSYSEAMNLPHRAAESCAYGLSKDDMVRALTLDAAEILGVGDKIGSIQAGKLGNLVISDGDPCELTSNIRYVFIDGQPVPLVSKHTRLRDQYLERIAK
jgi:imidazolonepropionase-like amidohydrolase